MPEWSWEETSKETNRQLSIKKTFMLLFKPKYVLNGTMILEITKTHTRRK